MKSTDAQKSWRNLQRSRQLSALFKQIWEFFSDLFENLCTHRCCCQEAAKKWHSASSWKSLQQIQSWWFESFSFFCRAIRLTTSLVCNTTCEEIWPATRKMHLHLSTTNEHRNYAKWAAELLLNTNSQKWIKNENRRVTQPLKTLRLFVCSTKFMVQPT